MMRPITWRRRKWPVGVLVILLLAGAGYLMRESWGRPAPDPAHAPRPLVTPVEPIVEIAPSLYLVAGGGCNTAVFVTRSGVLLVDTKYTESWDALMTEIRRVTDQPITHVVNTHSHPDHTEGNAHLPAGVRVVVHEKTAANLREMAEITGRSDAWLGTAPQYFTDRLTLFEGEEAVDLYHFGAAHTSGDTFVVFRAAKVMHPGDVFPTMTMPVINLESGGNGATFAGVVEQAARIPGVERVMTSHGPVVSSSELGTFARMNRQIFEHVRTNMTFGADKVKVFRSLRLPAEFAAFDQARAFDTMDEIDRSLRPWWQRVW